MIHVLKITEDEEDQEVSAKSVQRNNPNRISVKLAKPLSLNEPKIVAFVDGCDVMMQKESRHVQLASIKLHKSTELGPDAYLMQGT